MAKGKMQEDGCGKGGGRWIGLRQGTTGGQQDEQKEGRLSMGSGEGVGNGQAAGVAAADVVAGCEIVQGAGRNAAHKRAGRGAARGH
ncbi:hypothetical protein GOP47_0006415 [Adiantum capillus-veneris]|uniref:Uncharacterized protein n=1 Tax=Adiantum capillus-veneris TaxID=13818 RepID=A0A9D4ZKD5_ADICA|nr:hypothetical protein GOP47_0006415 [Adiantum capillus-veneris]